MAQAELRCEVVWADVDLLEIETRVQFDGWSGNERAYVTREELGDFADALERVAQGANEAVLDAGQADLTYAQLRIFEYGLARHLGMDVLLGRAADTIMNQPSHAIELRLAMPIERGQLSQFAEDLRRALKAERGAASLWLPADWPS